MLVGKYMLVIHYGTIRTKINIITWSIVSKVTGNSIISEEYSLEKTLSVCPLDNSSNWNLCFDCLQVSLPQDLYELRGGGARL